MSDDLSQYLPSWQDGRGLRGDNTDDGAPPLAFPHDAPGTLELDQPPPDETGAGSTPGPTGSPGPAATLTATAVLGGTGGVHVDVATTGATGNWKFTFTLAPGPTGSIGIPGPTGPTGPKASVIQTERGNIVFSCLEGARPWLFDIMRINSGRPVPLRGDFLAAIVPGSAIVQAVVPDYRCEAGARIEADQVIVDCLSGMPIRCTVTIAGINRNFPTWDLPRKTDAERERSIAFWSQEWRT